MEPVKMKIRHIDYSYHPDFVQDDNAPKGYYELDTGKWVVEWDAYLTNIKLYPKPFHYRHDCPTEEDAIKFCNKLRKGLDEVGAVVVDSSNGYYVGQ